MLQPRAITDIALPDDEHAEIFRFKRSDLVGIAGLSRTRMSGVPLGMWKADGSGAQFCDKCVATWLEVSTDH